MGPAPFADGLGASAGLSVLAGEGGAARATEPKARRVRRRGAAAPIHGWWRGATIQLLDPVTTEEMRQACGKQSWALLRNVMAFAGSNLASTAGIEVAANVAVVDVGAGGRGGCAGRPGAGDVGMQDAIIEQSGVTPLLKLVRSSSSGAWSMPRAASGTSRPRRATRT